jgi:ABC-type nitrate/sulfonate/bicarbonate transport system substrate-binding protein
LNIRLTHFPYLRGKKMSRNLACVNNRYAALQTEQVDGAILAEPVSLIGQEKGLVNLGDAYKLVPGYQLAGVWIKEEWAKKNRDLTLGFVRAFHNALVWLHDNRSEALELLPKITTLSKQNMYRLLGRLTPRRKSGRETEK